MREYQWLLHLVVVVQRRTCLVAAVPRWICLVAVVQRRTCLVADSAKLMVWDLLFYHLRYIFF